MASEIDARVIQRITASTAATSPLNFEKMRHKTDES